MKKIMVGLFLFVLGFVFIFSGLPAVNAQEAGSDEFMLEEITVTAEKRVASLQKTAISMSAITGENITRAGVISVGDLLRDVPNLEVQVGGRGFQFAIRGIGTDLPPNVGESSVSTNFDGIYNTRSEAGVLGYFDLDRVEVLRGPQGMLYGRNATGGVINVIMKEPTDELTGYASLGVGNYNLMKTEGAVNVPLNESFSARIAFAHVNRDGYLSNGMNDAKAGSIRSKLRYQPNDDFKIILTHQFIKLGGMSWGTVDKESFDSGRDKLYDPTPPYGSQNVKFHWIYANMELNAGPGVLTFLPSFEKGDGEINAYSPWAGGMETQYQPLDGQQYSGELRYASKSDARVQWVTGLYHYNFFRADIGVQWPLRVEATTKSYAAFGQVTYPFSDSLRGIVGGRYSKDEKGFDNPNNTDPMPTNLSDTWTAFDWKTGLEYDLSPDIMGYATLSTGHRPGGFNGNAKEMPIRFEMEEVLSSEIGVKSRLMDQRLQINASAYLYDYKDYQVSDFYMEEGAVQPTQVLTNAKNVTNYGAELEVEALVGPSTQLSMTGTYLKSEYDDPELVMHDGPNIANLDGVPLPHSPEFTFSGGIKHTFLFANGGTLTPSVTIKWTDDQYVRPYPNETNFQEAFTNVDGSITYNSASDKWSLNLYVRNATDEITKKAFFGETYNVSDPRQIGAVLVVNF